MNCKVNPKHTCGDYSTNARCVFYDLDIPEFSNINDESCITVEETIEDLYNIVSDLRDKLELSDFNSCDGQVSKGISKYDKKEYVKLSDILQDLSDKVCSISEQEEEDSLDLDFKCLVSPCGNSIGTLKDLLQTLIDEICTLKGS